MTKAFLPHLLKRPEAHVVNVSSMGGFFPVPGQTLYGPSKAAVKLLSEGLYAELLETPVRVSTVFPGAIGTNMMANSNVKNPMGDSAPAKPPPSTSPNIATKTILDGMERDRFQILVGKDAKMLNLLYRLSPRRARRFMNNQMKFLIAPKKSQI